MNKAAFSYRSDSKVKAFPDDKPIIIFDGHCVMCSGFARFILRQDKLGRIRLLPAQTPLGFSLYAHLGLDPVHYETNVLLENGQAYFKSDGSIRLFELLGFPWNSMAVFRLIPSALRDKVYLWIARNRFNWLGRRDVCFLSSPEYKDRFLE
jgi:predicted DCC family thiol-disulfide oxidoreductase YuxK